MAQEPPNVSVEVRAKVTFLGEEWKSGILRQDSSGCYEIVLSVDEPRADLVVPLQSIEAMQKRADRADRSNLKKELWIDLKKEDLRKQQPRRCSVP
jgi:hypothetical protein